MISRDPVPPCPRRSRTIQIGHHVEREWIGVTVQHRHDLVDPGRRRRSSCCSGFLARRQLTKDTEDHVPTKLQLVWETVVGEVTSQVEDNLGRVTRRRRRWPSRCSSSS